MSTHVITRKLEIDAGHRLRKHESKCRNLHGHRYVFEVTISAPQLDRVGRVIDFGIVKKVLGGWLDRHWDHGMIIEADDTEIHDLCRRLSSKVYTVPFPPTAENLADYFRCKSEELLSSHGLTVEKVRVYETPNCWADSEKES